MPRKARPNVPKNPRSAFLFFSQEERETIREKNPSTKFAEFGRILGEMWSQLSAEKKKKYQEKAKHDQQRYKEEVKTYLAGGGKKEDLKKERKAPKKTKKDPKGPKRPSTAYIFFSKEMRNKLKTENPKVNFGELGKLIGVKWKELDEAGKQKYHQLAEADKQRFEKEKGELKEAEDSNDEDAEEGEEKKAPSKTTTKKAQVEEEEEDDDEDEESSESE